MEVITMNPLHAMLANQEAPPSDQSIKKKKKKKAKKSAQKSKDDPERLDNSELVKDGSMDLSSSSACNLDEEDDDDGPPTPILKGSSSMSALPLLSPNRELPTKESLTKEVPIKEILMKRKIEKSASLGRSLTLTVSDSSAFRSKNPTSPVGLSHSGSIRTPKKLSPSTFDLPSGPPPLESLSGANEGESESPEEGRSLKIKKKLHREASEGTLKRKRQQALDQFGPPELGRNKSESSIPRKVDSVIEDLKKLAMADVLTGVPAVELPASPVVSTQPSSPAFVDPYLDHDFSADTRDDLMVIIQDLRTRLSSSERSLLSARTDRDRYAALVSKTNDSLLMLKEKVDLNINRMTIKAGEYKDKINSLQNLLAKEEEKNSVLAKKYRSLERKVESSDPVPLLRKISMSGGRKRSGNVVPYPNGIFSSEPALSESSMKSIAQGGSVKIRWSDKVRLGRNVGLIILEAKENGDRHVLEKFENLFIQVKLDEKEVGKTVLLSKKYLWNETFALDVTAMQEHLQLILFTKKSKSSKDNYVGSVTFSKDLLAIDSTRHELWVPLKEEKFEKPQPAVKLEFQFDRKPREVRDKKGPDFINLVIKIHSARNLTRSDGSVPSPYAVVQLAPDELFETCQRTESKTNTTQPVFQQEIKMVVDSGLLHSRGMLHITFWHDDPIDVAEFLGQAVLPLTELEDGAFFYKLTHYGSLSSKSALTLNPLSSFQMAKGTPMNSLVAERTFSMGAFVSFGQLTQLQERVLTAINQGVQQSHNHALKLTDSKTPCACDQCGGVIRAEKQMYKCNLCGITCHLGCLNHLQTSCDSPVCNLRISYKFTEDLILPYGAYNNLLEMLTDDNLLILTSLGSVCDQLEETASTLLNIFESQGSAVRYLSQLIAHEVKFCKDPNTIFRGNTLTSKSIDTYMKVVGHDYLSSVLKTTLDEIFSEKKSCELDPTRIELTMFEKTVGPQKVQEAQAKNLKNLLGYITKIVNSIFASVDRCPRSMRVVFGFLQEEVSKQFPNDPVAKYSAVSGFIFLRFFCPCVLGPKLFGLRDDVPQGPTLRTLTLLAKILQNLANGLEFGHKESFMGGVNEFIAAEKDSMRFFIDMLSNNWTTATERVSDLEAQIETQIGLIESLENMNLMYSENQDVGTKKARSELQKNIETSKAKVSAMRSEAAKIRKMCLLDNPHSPTGLEPDHSGLFRVDVEKELASVHRQLVRHKDAVLKLLLAQETEVGIKTASRLVEVLDELEETRIRLEKQQNEPRQ